MAGRDRTARAFLSCSLLPLVVASSLSFFGSGTARAADATVVVNPDRGVWDDAPRKTFQVLENLVLGSEEGDDAFGRIADVAVDSHGRWIILDAGHCRVQVYHPDEMTLKAIGREGKGRGEFIHPTALGVDAEDDIYVVSRDGRIAVFAPDGDLIDTLRHKFRSGPVTRIRIVPGGMYVSSFDPATHTMVHRYDSGHHYVSSFSTAWPGTRPMKPDEALAGCSGAIDVDADGNVIYTQWMPYEIRKFSPDGNLSLTIRRENDFMVPPTFERTAEETKMHDHGGSVGVLALPGGRILNVAIVHRGEDTTWPATYLDLFDTDGRLLKSRRIEGALAFRWLDASGMAYAIVTKTCPQVVRYRFEFP
jgi:hypothetical protein